MNIYNCQLGFGNEIFGGISLNIYIAGCSDNKSHDVNNYLYSELKDFNNGYHWNNWKNYIIEKYQKNFFTCFCLLGGEPLDADPEELLKLIQFLNNFENTPIYIYSGYDYDTIAEKCYNFYNLIYGVFLGYYTRYQNYNKDLIIFSDKVEQDFI